MQIYEDCEQNEEEKIKTQEMHMPKRDTKIKTKCLMLFTSENFNKSVNVFDMHIKMWNENWEERE